MITAFSDESNSKEINGEIFTELKIKFEILKILRHAEYNYSLIGQAYKNFEMSLFEVSFDIAHRDRKVSGIWWLGQQKIHISLIALLNTMYTYLDNLGQSYIKDLKKLTTEDMGEIENQFSRSHDGRLEYRIMKVLRDRITHVPYADIHGSIDNRIEEKIPGKKNTPWRRRSTNNPAIVIDLLTKGRRLRGKYRDDIKQMKQDGYNQFDIKFMLRGYIEEVAKIHSLFREKTESLFNDILTTLREVEMDVLPDTKIPPSVKLIKFATENNNKECYEIGHEFHSRLKDKRREWKSLGSEQKRYYSSAIILEDKKYPKEDPNPRKDKKLWMAK